MYSVVALLCVFPDNSWSSQVTRPIFQCTDADGQQVFTDSGCKGQQRYQPPAEAISGFSLLSAAELRRLKELSVDTQQASERRRRIQQQRQKSFAIQAAAAETACSEAKAALARLAAQRRKGYSIKDSAKLTEAEHKQQAAKRRYC
ncbi:MAG: hypothetical protein ACFHXK_02380 [bacterium]